MSKEFNLDEFIGMNGLDFDTFDSALWGGIIKVKRKKLKLTSVSDFVEQIWLRTRVLITVNTYYKVEQGKQEPTLKQFMAINFIIFKSFFPPDDVMHLCLSGEWEQLEQLKDDNEQIVPDEWAKQNYDYFKSKFVELGVASKGYSPTPCDIYNEFGIPENLILCLNPYAGC